MSKDRPLDLSGFASDRPDDLQGRPDRRIAVPPPPPRPATVTPSSEPEASPAEMSLPPIPETADNAQDVPHGKRRNSRARETGGGHRPYPEPQSEVRSRPAASSVRLSVSVPAETRRWLIERARVVGVVQADLLAAALDKHESEVRSQFQRSARWRRGAVPNLTVLGLYLQPVTADRLEQLAIDTGAKRSDLVTRVLALAMEEEMVLEESSTPRVRSNRA